MNNTSKMYNVANNNDNNANYEPESLDLQSLRMAAINANSIKAHLKRAEIMTFFDNHKLDILLISETKLTKKHKIVFPGKIIHRTDRPNAQNGGGTAIIFRENIAHEKIFTPSSDKNKTTEYSILKIKLARSKNLFIISIYANNEDKNIFIDEFDLIFEKLNLSHPDNYYIIAGDLNARHHNWGDRDCNLKGRLLKNWYDTLGLIRKAQIIIPDGPTYIPAGTYLDYCITDRRLKILNLNCNKIRTASFNSDHKALMFTVDVANICILKNNDIKHRFLFKKTKWKNFQKNIMDRAELVVPVNRNLSHEEVDSAIDNLTKSINESIETTVPKYIPQNNTLHYINSKIKKLQREKSELLTLKNYHKSNNSPHFIITQINDLITSHNNRLKTEFKSSYNSYWENLHKSIDHKNPHKFCPLINRWFRSSTAPEIEELNVKATDLTLLNGVENIDDLPRNENNDYIVQKPLDKLNVMVNHYASVNSPRYTNIGTETKIRVDKFMTKYKEEYALRKFNKTTITTFSDNNSALSPKPNNENTSELFCSPASLTKIIKTLPNKCSSGLDNIPSIVIKHLPPAFITALVVILNNALNLKYFPKAWKKSKIIPIAKKDKNPKLPSSYRPISLTPNLSKLLEILIDKHVQLFTHINKVMPNEQFGFQNNLSTCHAVNAVVENINEHLHNKQVVGACLIDIATAFDSTWLDGLIFILFREGFPTYLIDTIYDLIKNNAFVVSDGNSISPIAREILEGLMQGRVSSPRLFNTFTKKVLLLFKQRIRLPIPSHVAAYADDLINYCADKNPAVVQDNLQIMLNETNNYYREWNLRINPSKCETILFHRPLRFINSNRRELIHNFKIKLNDPDNNIDHPIAHKKVVRYLGVQLDYLLRFNEHVTTQLAKAREAFNKLIRLFLNNNIQSSAKVIAYVLMVRPIITYAAPIWWNLSASTMEKLRAFERSCLRTALKAYRKQDSPEFISNVDLYTLANIPRIDLFILKLTRDYLSRTKSSTNEIVKNFSSEQFDYDDKAQTGYFPPHYFTYYDKQGLIQDENNIPIIYHISRHSSDKTLTFSIRDWTNRNNIVYNTRLSIRDRNDSHRLSSKYWWLAEDAIHLEELRRRSRRRRRNT